MSHSHSIPTTNYAMAKLYALIVAEEERRVDIRRPALITFVSGPVCISALTCDADGAVTKRGRWGTGDDRTQPGISAEGIIAKPKLAARP